MRIRVGLLFFENVFHASIGFGWIMIKFLLLSKILNVSTCNSNFFKFNSCNTLYIYSDIQYENVKCNKINVYVSKNLQDKNIQSCWSEFRVVKQQWCFYTEIEGKIWPEVRHHTTLSIWINVLGFPGSAMFSRDAFSDQSAIIFHAPMVASLPPTVKTRHNIYTCYTLTYIPPPSSPTNITRAKH